MLLRRKAGMAAAALLFLFCGVSYAIDPLLWQTKRDATEDVAEELCIALQNKINRCMRLDTSQCISVVADFYDECVAEVGYAEDQFNQCVDEKFDQYIISNNIDPDCK